MVVNGHRSVERKTSIPAVAVTGWMRVALCRVVAVVIVLVSSRTGVELDEPLLTDRQLLAGVVGKVVMGKEKDERGKERKKV